MKKDILIFLEHILDSIVKIEGFIKKTSKPEFVRSFKTHDAVIRRLEIIGEATKNLPKSFREKHPDVPWNKIAKMSDKLIHGYFGVDLDMIWGVVKKELPDLKKKIEAILKKETE